MSVTKVTGMMQTGTKGGDIPSASTLVIDTDGDYFDITGTTGITAMTVDAGRRFTLQFDGAVTLTHGSSLYLPGATNFTTEANDCLSFIATAANTVRCTGYALKDGGSPVAASGGKILQCLSSTKDDAHSSTSTSFATITDLSVAITPAATSSKILVLLDLTGTFGRAGSVTCYAQLVRDSSVIYNCGAVGSQHTDFIGSNSAIHLDSPSSTSELVYACQMKGDGDTWTVNRRHGSTDVTGYSSITVFEIGA